MQPVRDDSNGRDAAILGARIGDWKEIPFWFAEPVVERRVRACHDRASLGLQRPVAGVRTTRWWKGRQKVRQKSWSPQQDCLRHTTVHWQPTAFPRYRNGTWTGSVGPQAKPHINPARTFVYEFVLKESGHFMYTRTPTRNVAEWPWDDGSFIVPSA